MRKFFLAQKGAELVSIIFGVVIAVGLMAITTTYITQTIADHTGQVDDDMFRKYGVYDGYYSGGKKTLEVKKDGTFNLLQITENGKQLIVNMDTGVAQLNTLNSDGSVVSTRYGTFNEYQKVQKGDNSYRYTIKYTLDGDSSESSDYFDFSGDNLCGVTEGGCS